MVQMVINRSHPKSKHKKGIRYDSKWILECLLLRMKSKSTYEHLRSNNILPLPCKEMLRKLISGLSCNFGFNKFALDAIGNNFKGKPLNERFGSLVFDEMSITQDLEFNEDLLQFQGLVSLKT